MELFLFNMLLASMQIKIKLNQLEKMKEGHDILSKKISEIQFEITFLRQV